MSFLLSREQQTDREIPVLHLAQEPRTQMGILRRVRDTNLSVELELKKWARTASSQFVKWLIEPGGQRHPCGHLYELERSGSCPSSVDILFV